MSINRVLQVLTIATNAIADATTGEVDMDKICGAIDILRMLEEELIRSVDGGEQSA